MLWSISKGVPANVLQESIRVGVPGSVTRLQVLIAYDAIFYGENNKIHVANSFLNYFIIFVRCIDLYSNI